MQGPPTGFWGKLTQEKQTVVAWHPLADHCADVAATCEALLRRTILGRRLARIAGLDAFSGVQVDRFCVLAALHDAGKFSIGFQNKALERPAFKCGHMGEVLGLLEDPKRSQTFLDALSQVELGSWSESMLDLLVATICHHGRPVAAKQIEPRWWAPDRNLDPFRGIEDLVERTRRWFPEAWRDAGNRDQLPANPELQHAWSGLVMLADWLGSSERFFPFSDNPDQDRMAFARSRAESALHRIGLDAEPLRATLGQASPGYERIKDDFAPRPAQERMMDLPLPEDGGITILEAATGSGKTEAALVHFLRLYHAGLVDGLYFALPTRTAATQIYERVCRVVAHAFPDENRRPPVVQAVPGYISVDDVEGVPLPHFDVRWSDEEFRYRAWAGEHPKRYLAGAIVVGTVDQVLLSALMVSHAHMRATALLRHLLVVDEVHASDTYMARLLEAVLDQHLAAGGHALLMSATLGTAARSRLLADPGRRSVAPPPADEAAADVYPAISFRSPSETSRVFEVAAKPQCKTVRPELVTWAGDAERIAREALAAATEGARVLVIRNTVADCRAVQLILEELAERHGRQNLLFRPRGIMAPHHSRYAKADRQLLDKAIEAAFGRGRSSGGCVAVATQTVEQSLDLDADLLITDLCPIDVLLQRIGRLHRHEQPRPQGFGTARAIVLEPVEELASMIAGDGKGKGPHGLGPVYEDLRTLEATRRILDANPEVTIPADNRRLVENGTHPAVLQGLVEELGGPWEKHQRQLKGRYFAEGRIADFNLVDRTKGFAGNEGSIFFPSGDTARKIPTRLGENDRLVRFAKPWNSPFGCEVKELSIPAWLIDSQPSDGESTDVQAVSTPEGVTFRFGTKELRYDRLGLALASGMSAPTQGSRPGLF